MATRLLAVCGLGTFLGMAGCESGLARDARLIRGPYLQLLTTDSVTVVWKTDAPATCSLAIRADGIGESIVDGPVGTTCALAAKGLEAGRSYRYVPRANGASLAEPMEFRTDDPTRPFTFLAFGDSGTGRDPQLRVRDRMLATPADFLLHTGDMVYEAGEPERFDLAIFEPYAALLPRLVLWPCLGNHDVRTRKGAAWRDAFYTPANNREHEEGYYSFRFGNGLFVVLDSNAPLSPGSDQLRFMNDALSADDARWKFVAFHHTIFSSGRHGSRLDIRNAIVPLFDRHHVDLVLMGHDHDYERTVPLRGGKTVEPGDGTVYVTTGGGGQTLRPVGHSKFTAFAESTFHFVRLAVDGETLQLQMIRTDGTIGDELRLTKPAALRPAA